ncbi:MAG: hypothetical protein R2817_11455 [Flavobacteriales bacterium]
MKKVHTALLTASLLSSVTYGQMGLRVSFLHYEPVEVGSNFHFVAGFDADLSPRSAMGLDYTTRMDVFGAAESNVENLEHLGYQVSVSPLTRSWSIALRSIYFLSDESSGAYVGPTIGYRSVSLELLPQVWDAGFTGNPNPSWDRRTEHELGYLQLGLRFGFRSELDGFFGDMHIGAGMNLGELEPSPGLPSYMDTSEWGLRKMFFQIGYSTGIGW